MSNPIIAFSATRRMRSFRTILTVTAYAGMLLLIACLMLGGMFGNTVTIQSMQQGVRCYLVLTAAQFALLVLIGPAMTSASIAGEKERRTLELLLVTNTRSFRIASGKMMESFALLALLIVSGLPAMCLTVVAGGVTFVQVLVSMLFLLAVAYATVCVGIFASACSRTSVRGGVMSYRIIALVAVLTSLPVIFGYPRNITDVVYDTRQYAALTPGGALGMIHPVLFFNPGYGLVALLQDQTALLSTSALEKVPGFGTSLASRAEYGQYGGWGRMLCTYLLMIRAGGMNIALISSGAMIGAGTLLTGVATLLIRPKRKKDSGQ